MGSNTQAYMTDEAMHSYLIHTLSALDEGWGTLAARYRALPAGEQVAYLDGQGYRRFGDLLAHVTAWWGQCLANLAALEADPNFQMPEVDVDAFNARSVERNAGVSDAAAELAFERQRRLLRAAIADLSGAMLNHPSVRFQLDMDVVGHAEEHALKELDRG